MRSDRPSGRASFLNSVANSWRPGGRELYPGGSVRAEAEVMIPIVSSLAGGIHNGPKFEGVYKLY